MDLMGGMQKAVRRVLVARGVQSSTVDVGGQSVHFYALKGQGKGPPVVLVHGLGGSANGFGRTFFGLARRFSRVIAPDLPGHGFSTEYCGGQVCVRNQFEVLRAFVEQEVKQPAFVVGNSLGGAMSVNLAAEQPQWVRALALVAPAGAELPAEENTALLNAFTVRTPAEARAFTRRLFHQAPLPALLLAPELTRFYDTPTVKALTAEVMATRLSLEPQAVRNLSMPVLFLWGGSERLLPSRSLDWFRANLPAHAQVRVVQGFGHVPQMERPDELVSHLVRFADASEL
ncbi:alpha/beta fold family hydrolase [Myxococcus stipitatus DSM 14675]|uniref:Alpha/beta fold family hydrolase n=1 Tax=Myxococcus stipitatus (strain DSM 14675 / JCM 12634 / Mx s8) TaxID=1278073 RepID=L7UM99_MYXSD|nr:alpha/beta fold hydrolase [Myxococcus stipitatus]AGC47604.1 alpha/beta fold family hydrolase [Myxococcus stipitatus DSM 14675]